MFSACHMMCFFQCLSGHSLKSVLELVVRIIHTFSSIETFQLIQNFLTPRNYARYIDPYLITFTALVQPISTGRTPYISHSTLHKVLTREQSMNCNHRKLQGCSDLSTKAKFKQLNVLQIYATIKSLLKNTSTLAVSANASTCSVPSHLQEIDTISRISRYTSPVVAFLVISIQPRSHHARSFHNREPEPTVEKRRSTNEQLTSHKATIQLCTTKIRKRRIHALTRQEVS